MDPNKSHWLDRCNAELSLGILNVSRRSWKPLQTYSRGRRVQDSLTHYSTKILMYSSRICLSQVVQEFSKKNAEVSSVTSNSATASPAGDAVPVTEAVLDGNDVPVALTEDASLYCQKTTPSRPMIKMMSCLFPSRIWWMITGHWVFEVRACSPHDQFMSEAVCRSARN